MLEREGETSDLYQSFKNAVWGCIGLESRGTEGKANACLFLSRMADEVKGKKSLETFPRGNGESLLRGEGGGSETGEKNQ